MRKLLNNEITLVSGSRGNFFIGMDYGPFTIGYEPAPRPYTQFETRVVPDYDEWVCYRDFCQWETVYKEIVEEVIYYPR